MILTDKIVLVTGSSRGIGKAVALKLAAHGANVVVNSRSDTGGGQDVVAAIKELGQKAIYIQGDVRQPDEVEKLFQEIFAHFGTIDILVNNVGNVVNIPFLKTTKDFWVQGFEDNFLSTVLCSVEAAKKMKEQNSGKIINTSSIRGIGHTGQEEIMAYSAAKAAVNSFTKTLAKELAPNITVNAVAPGFVHTSTLDKVSEDRKQDWLRKIPIRRFIQPEEIADAYLYLASSDIITGEILVADGGFTLKIS